MVRTNLYTIISFCVTACGGNATIKNKTNGFPSTYVPPEGKVSTELGPDVYYNLLKTEYVDPYWVAALEMADAEVHVSGMLQENDRIINYTFPSVKPTYDQYGTIGWQPATTEMISAARDIFHELEAVLNVDFEETDNSDGFNVISVARSEQYTTSAFAFFPNLYHEIGMDVFVSNKFENPKFITSKITNYDYEVLVHEIGHALGLKHPFEADGANTQTLYEFEDNTMNTVVSYNDNSISFNGNFRDLDWMTLTKYYGVNPNYKPDDDVYYFSSARGTFVIDGSGNDTIDSANSAANATIDLRQGAHSFLGNKSLYITNANQLTISHGSDIENVHTGSGDDTVIATALDNLITTGVGNDMIFAGDGADIIRSGTGSDRIDLSEAVQAVDTVTVDASLFNLGFDTIYGFVQGAAGDVLDLNGILKTDADLFPLVAAGAAPVANFSGGVLRLVGDALTTSSDLVSAFGVGGALSPLSMSDGARSIIVSAVSQGTGEDQSVFYAQGSSAGIQISQVALLQGNALDIDQWHAANFGLVA